MIILVEMIMFIAIILRTLEYAHPDFLENDLSTNFTRFVNASVQTPNKLLRMVAEEICGQSARKPHAERDFKVIRMSDNLENYITPMKYKNPGYHPN